MDKERLIYQLQEGGYLHTPLLIEAFQHIDRARFVPNKLEDIAYINQALSIGEEQTISQPLTVAFMLELLEPQPGERILDIGTGSGWQAALLGYVVSKDNRQGKVVTMERIKSLLTSATENIETYGYISKERVVPILGDGTKGYKKEAPYDKIIAAATGDTIPPAWKKQLAIGGIIVAPVGNSIYRIEKTAEDSFEKRQYFGFSFVPLISGTRARTTQEKTASDQNPEK